MSANNAISVIQASDASVLDAVCEPVLAGANGKHFGAQLATDGDASTYWLSSGVLDAVITIDLGTIRQLTNLTFDWRRPRTRCSCSTQRCQMEMETTGD